MVINTNVTHYCSICDAQAVKQFFDYVQCTLRIILIDSVNFAFLKVGDLYYVLAHILFFANISEHFCVNLADVMILCQYLCILCLQTAHFPCSGMDMTEKMVLRLCLHNEV